jgi:hypothetical protein
LGTSLLPVRLTKRQRELDDRHAASRRASAVLAELYDIDPRDVQFNKLTSFTDLIISGVSDDEDMRVFEIG